jgi:hypothetical protein
MLTGWHVKHVAKFCLVQVDALDGIVMDVLEESLLVLPDLKQVLAIAIELLKLITLNLDYNNDIVVSS